MWFVYILLVLIILSGGYVFLVLPRPKHFRPRSDVFEQTKFFAHRGLFDNGVVAENSLSAFKAAKKFGCGIELDIRLSKDGIPVVMHDRSLIRMCGVNKNVDDLNVDELKKLKLLDTEDCIPTLREVLDLVDGAVPLVIEMKAAGTDVYVCPQSEILLRHYNGTYAVESFNPFALRWYRIHRPEILRGQLATSFKNSKNDANPFVAFMASNLLFNFLSRPDFIAFDIHFSSSVPLKIRSKYFAAVPVGWTVRKETELNDPSFENFIFEGFLPHADK